MMKKPKKKQPNKQRFFKLPLWQKGIAYLLVIFLPTQLGRHFFLNFSYIGGVKVDYLSLIFYLTDLLALFLMVFNLALVIFWIKKHATAIVLISSLLLINILNSLYPILSFYHALKIIELVLVYIVFKYSKLNAKFLLLAFLGSGVLELGLGLLQLYFKSSIQGPFYLLGERYLALHLAGIAKASLQGVEFLRPYATFSHPNSLAGFYLLSYFFVLTTASFNDFRLLKYISLLIFTLLVFISFSKNAIITFIVLNCLYVFFFAKISCRICSLSRILIVTITGLIFIRAQTDPLSIEKRIRLFEHGIQIFAKHLILGTGLGHYLIYESSYPFAYSFFSLQPVHNIFVLFLAETGIILGGTLLIILIKEFHNTIRDKTIIILPLLVVLITGLSDHYWLTLQQNFLLLAVVFGWLSRKIDQTEFL